MPGTKYHHHHHHMVFSLSKHWKDETKEIKFMCIRSWIGFGFLLMVTQKSVDRYLDCHLNYYMHKHLEGKNGQVREFHTKKIVTYSGVTLMQFGRWVQVKIMVL